MLRRLLQRLEKRVGRFLGQHVNLVDDVDLVFPLGRGIPDVVAQFAHIIDAAIAGRVQLKNVKAVAARDFLAIVAHAAGRNCRAFDAIERLGQDARR